MDNVKTGALIKALRLERGLTQKQLAEKLNVTDRAVSKWERGKNAPDIALLEPLAEILGVTVLELIRGERVQSESRTEVESAALEVIDYSLIEIKRRRRERNKSLIATAATLLVIAAFVLFACWQADTSEFEVARQISPTVSVLPWCITGNSGRAGVVLRILRAWPSLYISPGARYT